MLIAILGVVLAFNMLIIYWKYSHNRYMDATLDLFMLVVLGYVFGGSTQSLSVATIASAIISLYLLAFPPGLSEPEQSL